MADIEIVYEQEYYCLLNNDRICGQCFSGAACDLDCPTFKEHSSYKDENGVLVITDGECVYAKVNYVRKGWSGKNYEIDTRVDPHNLTIPVTLGRSTYDCVKVKVDGKVIYNNYDDDD